MAGLIAFPEQSLARLELLGMLSFEEVLERGREIGRVDDRLTRAAESAMLLPGYTWRFPYLT